jgi:UDP-N-acetyl-D-glucosamine dehydrogenase
MKNRKQIKGGSMVDKIIRRREKIAVVGLGYVGLPLAAAFAQAGFQVTGLEVDAAKVDALNRGKNYIPDLDDKLVARLVREGHLRASTDDRILAEVDAVSICVPTPLRKTRDPDISYIVEVTEKLKKHLKKGQIIVLESTTYPGTTEEVLLPALESGGFKVGRDFFLAFSPERIDPANRHFQLRNTPKVIGGITEQCTKAAALLYRSIVDEIVPVSGARAAEMVKLLENTFRAVNIGLVNEIALVCDKLNINTWEVIAAAATKPFGFMPFFPGPVLCGHCIPVDPHYLSWKLKTMDYTTRFIELAGEVNREMPGYVFKKIQAALNEKRKAVKGADILLLGVAYKKNVADTRESPAYDVAKLLHQAGARLSYSDPFVPQWQTDWQSYHSKRLTPAVLKAADCVVILTNHDDFNMSQVVRHSRAIVDTRNATVGLPQKKIVRL